MTELVTNPDIQSTATADTTTTPAVAAAPAAPSTPPAATAATTTTPTKPITSGNTDHSSDNELDNNSAFHLHELSKDVDESDGEAFSDDDYVDDEDDIHSSPLDHEKMKNKLMLAANNKYKQLEDSGHYSDHRHTSTTSTSSSSAKAITTPPLPSNAGTDMPFSRIFIICGKDITETMLVNAFKRYGVIESCKVVTDKETNESKGIAYIKYTKTSSAALAIESMHGSTIADADPTPIKVLIAEDKGQGKTNKPPHQTTSDPEDTPPNSRLFVICKKDISESDLNKRFKDFGNLEHIKLVRERDTNESKGYAFVKFSKSSTAAVAMEAINDSDDKSIKAIIAQPKSKGFQKPTQPETVQMVQIPMMGASPYPFQAEFANPYGIFPTMAARQRLFVICHKSVTQENLHKLFSRYPGMEYCDLKKDKVTNKSKGFAYVNYSTPQAALIAKNELNGIKYPPGYVLKVVFAEPLGIKQSSSPVIDPISSIQTSFAQMPFIARRNSSQSQKRQKI
ncbi:hypothetical protein SAMD00019534_085660 [Acytostelium subglobosum LB1]|uniref:hypothetical protein n=1 Tax=Acytostelium subglobosum LB1 TaxID=1410327 RepID=UPI0006451F4E|nr:hypothetical protein SAMD00019534_085660 [Acytostelium subglobosum LB1]GAM25391.1 hypothetical protein SAMD00019534_085660 [Acytostelium subglobosum LB1]|eukprot:XP_012751911.1 hypothetical protein SAMD00019534_085660 [Acytostelium subglobosum LB1]